ncbi:MAG: hypothetical protein HYY40_11755 [Bacteroidetes bacterium]|nr:hypothetical protein [Bacteroidota bacterium]
MKKIISILTAGVLLATGCTSPQKMYQKGNYDGAIVQAVKKLRKNPRKEKHILTLEKSYLKSNEQDNSRINFLKMEGNPQSWDEVYSIYNNLKLRQERVRSVTPLKIPSTGRVIQFSFIDYDQEIISAKKKAAEYLYNHAQTLLDRNDRESAKKAYFEFKRVKELYSNFMDVDAMLNKAKLAATIKVVVEPIPMHSRTLELSNEFFENKIHEFMLGMQAGEFVRFYSRKEAQSTGITQPDHTIIIKFDDFIVGQAFVKEEVHHLSKDSVVVGTVKLPDGTTANVYNTVKAEFHHFKKTIVSKGLLDFKIIDASGRVLTQDKFPGGYDWFCEWGFFNGDERALNDKQKKIAKLREMPPPPPQDLFIEFTKPIYSQVTGKVKSFYSGY